MKNKNKPKVSQGAFGMNIRKNKVRPVKSHSDIKYKVTSIKVK